MRRRVLGLFTLLGLTACSTLPSSLPAAWRPLSYAVLGGDRVSEGDYSFQTHDGLTLSAKLTRPAAGARRPPVVIFVGGSGTWDSDYSQRLDAGHHAFVLPVPELARRSAAAGMAFVRYQKRGVTDPGGRATPAWRTVRLGSLKEDLRRLIAKIQADPTLDGTRIALLGHSEGSAIATWVGGSEPAVRAFVFLGLMRQNLREVYRLQLVLRNGDRLFTFADTAPKDGRLEPSEIEDASKQGFSFEGWKAFDGDRDGKLSRRELLTMLDARYAAWVRRIGELSPDELVPGDGSPAGWFQQHFAHPSVEEAWRSIRRPVLVLQGLRDRNTPFKTEAEPFQAMLAARRHPDYRVIGLEGLDHWLKDPQGAFRAEPAFAEIVAWLKQRL